MQNRLSTTAGNLGVCSLDVGAEAQKRELSHADVGLPTINEHKKIYADGELPEESTIRKFQIVQTEGDRQINCGITHYNLQMIIAVGFKVVNIVLSRIAV